MKGKKKEALVALVGIICLSVVICCIFITKFKEANFYEERISFEAQYISTKICKIDERKYPVITVIHSREELNSYYEVNKDLYDLERREKVYEDDTIGFLDACDRYDEEYFKSQELVLVLIYEGSSSTKHEVTDLYWNSSAEKKLKIAIDKVGSGFGNLGEAYWHIFIEIEKGVAIEDESQVVLEIGETERVSYEEYFE